MIVNQDIARELVRHPSQFHTAAERLSKTKPPLFHPPFYCVLHAIELGLKAHLSLAGFSKRCLKLLGHDLAALVSEAHAVDAISFLDGLARKQITWGGRQYMTKDFEYPEKMVQTHPIGRWLQISREVISNAESRIATKA